MVHTTGPLESYLVQIRDENGHVRNEQVQNRSEDCHRRGLRRPDQSVPHSEERKPSNSRQTFLGDLAAARRRGDATTAAAPLFYDRLTKRVWKDINYRERWTSQRWTARYSHQGKKSLK